MSLLCKIGVHLGGHLVEERQYLQRTEFVGLYQSSVCRVCPSCGDSKAVFLRQKPKQIVEVVA